MIYDSVIIGSGPAGYSAAIYISQAGYSTLLVLGEYGGAIGKTSNLCNYPGLVGPISGLDLISNLNTQASNSGVNYIFGNVISFEKENLNYKLIFDSKEEIISKSIIFATGSIPRILNIENENKFFGKGIHTCALCDGAFYKDKDVAVIGGGNSAAEYALYLSKICKTVYICYRKSKMKVTEPILNKLISVSNIIFKYNTEIKKYPNTEKIEYVTLNNNETLSIQGIFYALGQIPNTNTIKSSLIPLMCDSESNFNQEIINKNNLDGIFVAGDCTNIKYKQAIIAAADGAKAGIEAINYLNGLK